MILYRKGSALRVRRSSVPAPPFWYATAVSPYGPRRSVPLSLDYLDLRAMAADRVEVPVSEDALELLTRQPRLTPPVLVDAAEAAEAVYARGAAITGWCATNGLDATLLISTASAFPAEAPSVIVAAWPLDLQALLGHFAAAREKKVEWGVFVPILHPLTTGLEALEALAGAAAAHGARYLASASVEAEPVAKQVLASSLSLDGEDYDRLFHSDLDALHVATERHLAALASEHGMLDFVPPRRAEERSNWNASILLTLTATRMLAMGQDVELAGALARSARVVAELEKPLERIAEAASLAIVEALDEASVDVLSDWLKGGSGAFVDRVNAEWRLRRDHY